MEEKLSIFREIFAPSLCWLIDYESGYIRSNGVIQKGQIIMAIPGTALKTDEQRIAQLETIYDAPERFRDHAEAQEAVIIENKTWHSTWDGTNLYFKAPMKCALEKLFRSSKEEEKQQYDTSVNCTFDFNDFPNGGGKNFFILLLSEFLKKFSSFRSIFQDSNHHCQ